MKHEREPPMDRKMHVEILFKEYDTLREEILSRMNNRFTFGGLLGVIAAFVGSQTQLSIPLRLGTGLLALVTILVLWWFLGLLIYKAHLRIAALEKKINELAGADLLEWESNVLHRPFGRMSVPLR